MKELPLLSSDFPYFSWEEQTGNATVEQLQKAYNAVISEGKTTDFSRVVWNDLVELLYQAIIQSGLTWIDSYGSVEDTKIISLYGKLTAKRFNAMTINIDTIINNAWRWEVNPYVLGYVARARFYGIAEKKKKGDYVYGWYIIILADVINLLIAVLKNEADFAEFKIENLSSTPTDVSLLPRISAPMFYAKSSATIKEANLLPKISRPMYVSFYSRSINNVELLNREPKRLTSMEKLNTVLDVNLIAKKWHRMGYRDLIKSNHEINMTKQKAINFGVYETNIKTTVEGGLSFHRCLDMYYRNIYSSIQKSSLALSNYKAMLYSNIVNTMSDAQMNLAISYALGVYEKRISSLQQSEITNVLSRSLGTSEEKSISLQSSEMNMPLVGHFSSDKNRSHSLQSSEMATTEPLPVGSENLSKSTNESSIVAGKVSYVNASEISNSIFENDLAVVKPKFVDAAEMSSTLESGEVDVRVSSALDSQIHSKSKNLVSLRGLKVLELGANLISKTLSKSSISFEGIVIDDEWAVQNGSNLYILQIYDGYKESTDLYIDT